MWPFKSKIPILTSISRNGENITFTHKSGVYYFNESEIVKTTYSSDFFSEEKYYDDRFNFLNEINWLFPNSRKFKTANTLWFLLLFGGMLNMLTSLFPFVTFYAKENIILNTNDYNSAHKIILVLSAFILTYLLFVFSIYMIKRNRIRTNNNYYKEDVLSIWTNNQFIKVRINKRNDPFNHFETEENILAPSHWLLDKPKIWIPSLIISSVILLCIKINTPFWFYNYVDFEPLFDNPLRSAIDSGETFQYWAYYSEFTKQSSNSWNISQNVNPFIAFFDGFVSNYISIILIPASILLAIMVLSSGIILVAIGPLWIFFFVQILVVLLFRKNDSITNRILYYLGKLQFLVALFGTIIFLLLLFQTPFFKKPEKEVYFLLSNAIFGWILLGLFFFKFPKIFDIIQFSLFSSEKDISNSGLIFFNLSSSKKDNSNSSNNNIEI
jgi:hypothetical protein